MVQKLRNTGGTPVTVSLVSDTGEADSVQLHPYGVATLDTHLRVTGDIPASVQVSDDQVPPAPKVAVEPTMVVVRQSEKAAKGA